MNLDNLKPAWQRFRLSNSMQRINQKEILLMIETVDGIATNPTNRFLMHTIVFVVLTLCCQGG